MCVYACVCIHIYTYINVKLEEACAYVRVRYVLTRGIFGRITFDATLSLLFTVNLCCYVRSAVMRENPMQSRFLNDSLTQV